MATKDSLYDAQVPISKCEVCDRGVDARFYCQECTQEMCKDCQERHLRMTSCRNHTIIRIAADKDISIHQKETSKLRCETHLEEAVQMYCLTCSSPVCHTCISDKIHRNHAFDKLVNVADKYKEILSQLVIEIKLDISDLVATLQSIENNIQDYTKLADKTIIDIIKQREQIKAEAEKVANVMIREVQQGKFRDVKTMQIESDKIKKIISDDQNTLVSYEAKLKSDIDTSVKEFKTVLSHKKKKSTFSISPLHPPRYVRYDVKDLDIFGKLEEQKDKIISTAMISSINPGIPSYVFFAVSDTEAWCGHGLGLGRDLVLVQPNGTVKKNLKLKKPLYDITVTTTGDVLYTEEGGYTIQRYSLDDKVTAISNTKPYKPNGISITANQDLLVCLYHEGNDNKVVRMSLNGQIKQTIQYNKQNQLLFSDPILVTENINGDICVADGVNNVAVVNKDGQFRFRYPESVKSTHTIGRCYGIACDKLGYILISDFINNHIHQIDNDGKIVRFILTEQHGIMCPGGLSVDDKGQLWVCNGGGSEVRVYKYRS